MPDSGRGGTLPLEPPAAALRLAPRRVLKGRGPVAVSARSGCAYARRMRVRQGLGLGWGNAWTGSGLQARQAPVVAKAPNSPAPTPIPIPQAEEISPPHSAKGPRAPPSGWSCSYRRS